MLVRVALPDIGAGFGLKALIDLGRAEGRFHGWGNESYYNQSYTDHGSSEYIDSNYYSHFVERRRALLMLSRTLWSSLWLDVGGSVEDARHQGPFQPVDAAAARLVRWGGHGALHDNRSALNPTAAAAHIRFSQLIRGPGWSWPDGPLRGGRQQL